MNRQEEFDIAKGIAIYLVVLGHLLSQVAGKEIILITFCHMPVFFWISGYFLNKRLGKWGGVEYKDLVSKRIDRLLVPYIFWSFISLAVNVAMRLVSSKMCFADFLDEFINIFIFSRSVWFLIVLLISELICILACYVTKVYKYNMYVILLIVWFLISMLPIDSFFYIYKFKWLFPFFILGMLCDEYEIYDKTNKKVYLIGLLFIVGRFLFYNEKHFEEYVSFAYSSAKSLLVGMIYYVLSTLSICLVFAIAIWTNRIVGSHYLALVGRYSLEVYVIHMLFVKFVSFVPDIVMSNDVYIYIYFAIYAVIIIIAIVLISKYILEKVKLFRIAVGKI